MIFRCKTPLRLGLAGGGTDIAEYANKFGGAVLNVTINLYAFCNIEVLNNGTNVFESWDLGKQETSQAVSFYDVSDPSDPLVLLKGVYNRVVKDYCGGKPLSLHVFTSVDAPCGSGLGTSSTVVVSILKCFVEMLSLPLSEYDIAHLAYSIEREDLKIHGGKQDQYAAVFGGFNFMEFYGDDKVVVNPLRVHTWIKNELQSSLVLFYIGKSHDSSKVILDQIQSVEKNRDHNLEAMHQVKALAYQMKEAMLKGEVAAFEGLFNQAWEEKKKTSPAISNSLVDEIYHFALSNGAVSGKISGAGGGGCMFFFTDPKNKSSLSEKLVKQFGGKILAVDFAEKGAESWKIFNGQ